MKNKKLLFIIIFVLLLIPFKIKAYNVDTKLISVNESYSFKGYNTTFTDMKFIVSKYGSIGVTFNVKGSSLIHEPTSLRYYLFFYDSNKKMISNYMNFFDLKDGDNVLSLKGSLPAGYSYKDIAYFKVVLTSNRNTDFGEQYYDNGTELLDYYITGYDINMKVNNDNSLDIVEKINVIFNEQRHGINRNIPLYVDRDHRYVAKISKIKVNDKFTKSVQRDYYNIKIGDKNNTFVGNRNYEISYKYSLGKDIYEDKDMLFYNLIGDDCDTIIKKVTFKIDMPKEFDSSKLEFAYGYAGSDRVDNLKFSVDGNSIVGSLDEPLYKNQALTVKLELPEGYFVLGKEMGNYPLIIVIALVVISIVLWLLFGLNRMVVETVEFYPPDGINSLDLAFLYREKVRTKDVTSLLIYLANRGYLDIKEKDSGFEITKLKEYDGNNVNEKVFMNGLFRKDLVSTNEKGLITVDSESLFDNFYIVMTGILNSMNGKEKKESLLETNKTISIVMLLFAILIFVFITINPIISYGIPYDSLENMYVIMVFSLMFIVGGFFSALVNNNSKAIMVIAMIVGFSLYICGMLSIFKNVFSMDKSLSITFIVGLVSIIVILICRNFLSRKNKYATDMLGRIRGFKKFLETAEKDQLNSLVTQNPNYFFDILPYTYVLDISSKWISKFEAINMSAPNWYNSDNFNFNTFNSFIDRSFDSVDRNYKENKIREAREAREYEISSGHDSFGGSSSGGSSGGFSGGGSGGGGVSSW